MPFSVSCPHCHASLKAQTKHVGKNIPCPKCKVRFVVVAPVAELESAEEVTVVGDANPAAADLTHLDFSNLGIPDASQPSAAAAPAEMDPFDSPWDLAAQNFDGHSGGPLASNSTTDTAGESPFWSQPTTPGKPSVKKAKSQGLSGKTIWLIVAGSVGGLALIGIVAATLVWQFGSAKSTPTPTVASNNSPPTDASGVATPADMSSPEDKSESNAITSEEPDAQTVAGPGLESGLESAVDAPEIALAANWEGPAIAANLEGNDLLATFVSDAAGTRKLKIVAFPKQKRLMAEGTQGAQEYPIPQASGIQLAERIELEQRTWRWQPTSAATPELVDKSVDEQGFRLLKLRPFGTAFISTKHTSSAEVNNLRFVSQHVHLWAPDGKTLYVMAGNPDFNSSGPRHLLKIDAQSWQILAQAKMPTHDEQIDDIAWSSEGIVLIKTMGKNGTQSYMRRDDQSHPWFPLLTATEYASILVTVDPDTLRPKKGWNIPRVHQVTGSPGSDMVHVVGLGSYVATINVKTGQLVDLQYGDQEFREPTASPDGKWVFTSHREGKLNRFSIEGTRLVLQQQKDFGQQMSDAILAPDASLLTLQGSNSFVTVASTDFANQLVQLPRQANGKFVIDPVTKTGYLCSQDKVDGELTLRIIQDQSAKLITLEPAQTGQKRPSSIPRDTQVPNELRGQVPLAMSVAPHGRGALVFTQDAAYWISIGSKGASFELSTEKPEQISVVSALADTSEEDARITLPQPIADPFVIRSIAHNSKGMLFQLPVGQFMRRVSVNPQSGDLALVSLGGTREQNGTWLTVVPQPTVARKDLTPPRSVLFPASEVDVCFRQFQGKNLLLVARSGMLWVLDPQTLQLADASAGLKTQIDFRAGQYAPWMGDDRLSNQLKSSLYVSQDEPLPHVLYGIQVKSGRTTMKYLRIDLTNGEVVESLDELPTGWRSAAGATFDNALDDPHGDLIVDGRGVAREGKQTSWPQSGTHYAPLATLEKRPFIVARSRTQLHFHSRDDLSSTVDVDIPQLFQNENGMPNSFALDDSPREQLIIGGNPLLPKTGDSSGLFWILPLKQIKLPNAPLLAANVSVPTSLAPDQPASIPIELADSRAKMTLFSGPDGAVLRGNHVMWHPKKADVGEHNFILRLSAGRQSVEKKFNVRVGFSMVDLPFAVASIHMTADGEKALAWDDKNLAVVDVSSRNVLARCQLNAPLANVATAHDRAYLLYSGGNVVEARNLSDLTTQQTYPLTDPIRDMLVVGNRFLVLINGDRKKVYMGSRGKFYAFELPAFESSKTCELLASSKESDQILQTVGGNWILGPLVMDSELKSAISLFNLDWTGIRRLASSTPLSGVPVSAPVQRDPRAPPSVTLAGGTLEITPKAESTLDRESRTRYTELKLDVSTLNGKTRTSQEIAICKFPGLNGNPTVIATAGQGLAVSLSGKMFSANLEDLGVIIPKPPQFSPLSVRAKEKLTILAPSGKTQLQFVIEGGRQPYEFTTSLPENAFGSHGRDQAFVSSVVQADLRGSTLSIDGAPLVDSLLEERGLFSKCLEDFARDYERDSTTEKTIDKYVAEVMPNLKMLTAKAIRGVPVSLPFTIIVKDADSTEIRLSHELLIDIPRKEFSARLEPLLQRIEPRPADYWTRGAGTQIPRPDLPLIWNGSPIDVSQALRKTWPVAEVATSRTLAGQAALTAIVDNRLYVVEMRDPAQRAALKQHQLQLLDGTEITGAAVAVDSRGIRLLGANKGEISYIASEKLSDESLQKIWEQMQLFPLNHANLKRGDKHQLGLGMDAFRGHFGCLPPAAILDETGRALLSWRVMLLPYIGYRDLFQLFHLDEAWDSPHNLTLLPYMPLIYNPSKADLPLGQTTLLARTGPGTAFPPQELRRMSELAGSPQETLLLVEVDQSFALAWTKPEDLPMTEDDQWKSRLLILQSGNKTQFNGLFGDGAFKSFE